MEWYIKALRHYIDFNGRARRKEYWMFVLFNSIFAISAILLDNILGITFGRDIFYGPFYILYGLITFLPNLAVAVRRLHDIGKSGWMFLINLIPIVGPIWFLVLMITDSDSGGNEFGRNPKTSENSPSENKPVRPLSRRLDETSRDNLVLLVVIWILISEVFWIVVPRIYDQLFSSSWYRPIRIIMNLIWGLVPVALAFSVKEKNKQLILFVLAGIYFITIISQIITMYTY